MEQQDTGKGRYFAHRSRRLLILLAVPLGFCCVFGWASYHAVQRMKLGRPLMLAVYRFEQVDRPTGDSRKTSIPEIVNLLLARGAM